MPVSKSKQGKPLGGIGAERQSGRKHSLILDDRLLSKQYITNKLDARVSDDAFSSSWADVTDVAASKDALNNKFNALSVTTSAWTQEDAAQVDSKTRTYDSGNVGIGSTLAYSAITEMLTVGGNIKATGSLLLGSGVAATDYSITFDGETNDGVLTWMEDEDYFKFSDDILINSTEKLYFNDTSQFIHGSTASVLSIGATDEIDLTATTIQLNGDADINGAADVSGNLTVGGNTTITGNLTVNGTATSLATEAIALDDNTIILNSNATGTTDADAGIEIERGDLTNVGFRWSGTDNAWQVQAGTDVVGASAGAWTSIATGASTHNSVTIDNQGLGLLSLSTQAITVNDVMLLRDGAGTLDVTGAGEKLIVTGTGGNSGTTAIQITGGASGSSNAAVSITGHLEATTKSFNIPHPLLDSKRLVYGSLEGPEHGMYQRGSFDIEDGRRIVAIDLPVYWSAMTYDDYTVNLTTYGDYNVWISNRDENGFWVETNAEKEWSFDWNVIAGRKDAKLVVEPDA
jgi:hypothetical protein